MALNVYSPPETAVIHKTTVDIGNIRPMAQVVKLTQGDKSLPLIAVKLLNSGQPYEVPESATDAVFNFRKGDRKAVINSALGVSSDRQTVYVEATEQTCASAGRGEAIVQIQVGEQVAGTGIFCIDVTPNPTTDASLSDTEIGVLQGLVDEANDAKADAQQSASEASQSASDAQESAGEASDSATLAGQHKDDAENAKNSAEQFANTAEQEATNAENARDQAEVYMEKAQASSAVSNSSYYIGDDGMLHLKFDSDGLGQKDIDQTLANLQSDVEGLQSTIDSLSEMVTDQAGEITELQGELAEVPSMIPKQNLLVNGDFNCNQRGIGSGGITTSTPSVRKYGLDNWYCYTTASGDSSSHGPLDDGGVQVSLSGKTAEFGQCFEYNGKSDDITVVLGVKNSSGGIERKVVHHSNVQSIANGAMQTVNFNNGTDNWELDLWRSTEQSWFVGYSIFLRLSRTAQKARQTINLAYVDVFEGTEAPPHQIEPIAIALQRCQRWICKTCKRQLGYNNGNFIAGFMFPVPMRKAPSYFLTEIVDGNNNDATSNFTAVNIKDEYGVSYIQMNNALRPTYEFTIYFSAEVDITGASFD